MRETIPAARRLNVDWFNLTRKKLVQLTKDETGRSYRPSDFEKFLYSLESGPLDVLATGLRADGGRRARTYANMTIWVGHPYLPPSPFGAITIGHVVFVAAEHTYNRALLAHEYIHVIQQEHRGLLQLDRYFTEAALELLAGRQHAGPGNREEALGYLWESYVQAYKAENGPWCEFRPTDGNVPGECG